MNSLKKWPLLLLLLIFSSTLFASIEASIEKGGESDKTVLLAILARNKAHVLPKYLRCIENQNYDKKLINIYINTNNNQDDTLKILEEWVARHRSEYNSIIFESHNVADLSSDNTRPHEWSGERFKVLGMIRNQSMRKTLECGCDYYFVVDCDNFITPCTLPTLVQKQKPIIAPLLMPVPEPGDLYANYFAAVNPWGYIEDHPDYLRIFFREMMGTFKVPVVHCTYLIDSKYIPKLTYTDHTNDYEFVIFSRSARRNFVDQYICNEEDFGTLLHFWNDVSLEEEILRFQMIESSI